MTEAFAALVHSEKPSGPRILAAEDDPAAADILETLLERGGYQVKIAADGRSALRLLEEEPLPDVLLLDWMLPELTGLEICRWARERWDALALPILMVTARTDAESISAAFEAGASDYLSKPFLGAELRARIAAQLRISQLLEERREMDEHLMEREKLSTLGLLVSGVAHDLNNPLAGISGYAQLLLEEETDPEKAAALHRMMAEVHRCNRIAADLLSFARKHPPERTAVKLQSVLEGTLGLRERHLEAAGIGVALDVEPDLPEIRGDPHQLQQVFVNILVNAEHAMKETGGSVRIEAHRSIANSDRLRNQGWMEVKIFNDGPPIPREMLPHIFDPFFTTKGEEEGTGLGLAICRRVITEHGGEIGVETGEEGTTFAIKLPLPAPAAPEGKAAMPSRARI